MEQIIAQILSSPALIQGGGILIAILALYLIASIFKITVNLKVESDARITALTRESFEVIRDNSIASNKVAEAIGRHDEKITHMLEHAHRGRQNCDATLNGL